jgi:hypothetical protein
MDFLQFLPGLFAKFHTLVDAVLYFLNPIPHARFSNAIAWRVRQDSNLQQPDLESGALPIGATDPCMLVKL